LSQDLSLVAERDRRKILTNRRISKRKGVNKGLTAVEVLVVVVVVAFLLSILVPALARVKTAAREEVECRANLRQVGIVIQMSLQENDFILPKFNIDDTKNPTGYPGDNVNHGSSCNAHLWTADGLRTSPRLAPTDAYSYWGTSFNDYVKDIDIFRCPAISQFAEMLANDGIFSYGNLAPGVDVKDIIETASYGLNGYVGGGLNVSSLRNRAETIVCTDHVEPRYEQAHKIDKGDMFCRGKDSTNLTHYRAKPFRDPLNAIPHSLSNFRYRAIFRHNIRQDHNWQTGGRASVLWLDGRVSTIEETYGDNIPNRWYDPRGIWLDIQ
jgi:prepilin-type processing-associated H-X9-DG protein